MGNCQAIDNASLAIQHPNGRVDSLYCPVSAKEIMKMNPGFYVALLLTTTLYSSSSSSSSSSTADKKGKMIGVPLRVTRIKLLKPTDTLLVGHVYRLVTTQEVMKGLKAKKQARMKQLAPGFVEKYGDMTDKEVSELEAVFRKIDLDKAKGNRSRSNTQVSKSRGWEPSLNSISEAAS